ncbi:ADP-ribosylglycohydrolase family protein [Phycisphaera mikurensis]|uniref:Putative hydrolase n=1 Tax=Phycisphaera mikurensis (strain NBRC 102666 / KCTC 22515 / FYK2301M01) TaxID=1142394 RepID=I0IIX0_PHYMF|nr:ADP-ribosylglycohydrolase family protein [Phycisphaera mikurensis]MBB6443373.1 ADP-ribosylglycohydrolase [Phycisphaera mikurensis]BAM05208.1 putative hydrolase [Phycisphaera mikurensis NBRC 102666]
MNVTPTKEQIRGCLLGHAVGDALGVPVEFAGRDARDRDPVTGMRAYGTHHQPAGTWSDDHSLTLASAVALTERGWDLHAMADEFTGWLFRGKHLPRGSVFDVGGATREAISKLDRGVKPEEAGGTRESSNGNGSLMRMAPAALFCAGDTPEGRRLRITNASRLTHGHPRTLAVCALYAEIVATLVAGSDLPSSLDAARSRLAPVFYSRYAEEEPHLHKLMTADFATLPRSEISGSGYVVHTLEAALWCCLNFPDDYATPVLAAVNLGLDTDTTGAVTGSLAGLIHGETRLPAGSRGDAGIPEVWLAALTRREHLEEVCHGLAGAVSA